MDENIGRLLLDSKVSLVTALMAYDEGDTRGVVRSLVMALGGMSEALSVLDGEQERSKLLEEANVLAAVHEQPAPPPVIP